MKSIFSQIMLLITALWQSACATPTFSEGDRRSKFRNIECELAEFDISTLTLSCKSGEFIKLLYIRPAIASKTFKSDKPKDRDFVKKMSLEVGTLFSVHSIAMAKQGDRSKLLFYEGKFPVVCNVLDDSTGGYLDGFCSVDNKTGIVVYSTSDLGCLLVTADIARFNNEATSLYREKCRYDKGFRERNV